MIEAMFIQKEQGLEPGNLQGNQAIYKGTRLLSMLNEIMKSKQTL